MRIDSGARNAPGTSELQSKVDLTSIHAESGAGTLTTQHTTAE